MDRFITLYIIEDAFRQSFYGSTMWLWGFPLLVFLLADRAAQILLAGLTVCFLLAWLVR